MELSSILKVQIKNLWKACIIFISFWIIVGLVLLIPNSISKTVYQLIYSSFLVTSISFITFLAIEIYGNYGKTFIFIQNNRFNYIISGIIWNFVMSIILTFLMWILKLTTPSISGEIVIQEVTFKKLAKYLGMVLCVYILFYNIGSVYSLFFQYHKKRKKLLILALLLVFLLFGYFTLPYVIKIMTVFINFETSKIKGWYYIIVIGVDILSVILTTIYYCKQNILKAYSNE